MSLLIDDRDQIIEFDIVKNLYNIKYIYIDYPQCLQYDFDIYCKYLHILHTKNISTNKRCRYCLREGNCT